MNGVPWLGAGTGPGSVTRWLKIAEEDSFLHSQSVAQSDSFYKNTRQNHKDKPCEEPRGQQSKYNSPIKYGDRMFCKDLVRFEGEK